MTTNPLTPRLDGTPAAGRPSPLANVWVLPIALLFVAAPFLGAGTLAWPAGWAYLVLIVGGAAAGRVLMARAHPELVAERARYTGNAGAKPYERFFVPIIAVGPTVIALVAGLDRRLGWPPAFSPLVQWIGAAIIVFGLVFATWAMVANRFFSSVVRIQADRGQQVVSDGPYRYVRHPGYAGSVPAQFGIALLLGSAWALVPALLTAAVIVVRTSLEDRLLQEELAGYRTYAGRVRYRLVLGIW
ncbi:MAG TPA: isoprenylcysteine carboxylmethyltransferase family protein [Anaerolineae bacterium]